MEHENHRPMWQTPSGLILCAFMIIAAFYLLTEHTAHVFGVLPYLLLLACPLMHLFMHHGGHGHGSGQTPPSRPNPGEGTGP